MKKKAQKGTTVKADSVNNDVMLRQLFRESRFKSDVINKGSNAQGLAQLRPIAVKELKDKYKLSLDPLKPKDAIKGHKKLMTEAYNRPWINKEGTTDEVRTAKALASYNWGPTSLIKHLNAKKAAGIDIYKGLDWLEGLPKETKDYIYDSTGKNPIFEEEFKKAAETFKHKGAYPVKQDGGWLSKYEEAQSGKEVNIDSTLNANKHLDWVKRLYDKDTPSMQIPGQEGLSTHFMESGDGRVYPTVVNKNGKLEYLGDKARHYADSTNTAIHFKNDAQAEWFGKNYKEGKGVLKEYQKGGVIKDNRGQWAKNQKNLLPLQSNWLDKFE